MHPDKAEGFEEEAKLLNKEWAKISPTGNSADSGKTDTFGRVFMLAQRLSALIRVKHSSRSFT